MLAMGIRAKPFSRMGPSVHCAELLPTASWVRLGLIGTRCTNFVGFLASPRSHFGAVSAIVCVGFYEC